MEALCSSAARLSPPFPPLPLQSGFDSEQVAQQEEVMRAEGACTHYVPPVLKVGHFPYVLPIVSVLCELIQAKRRKCTPFMLISVQLFPP